MEPQNPFSSPSTDIGLVDGSFGVGDIDQNHAEAVRRAHIGHEASVRSIGLLYLLGGIFGVFSLVSTAVAMVGRVGDGNVATSAPTVGLFILLGTTVIQLAMGIGLRRLRRWAQVGATMMTGLGLLIFAISMVRLSLVGGAGVAEVIILAVVTGIPVYVLWLLVSPKGRMVFSQEYQAIRAVTPEINYRTSVIVKICVGLLAVLILLVLVFVFLNAAAPA